MILFTGGSLSRVVSVWGTLCPGVFVQGSLSRGLCPGGGVSVQGGLCQGDPLAARQLHAGSTHPTRLHSCVKMLSYAKKNLFLTFAGNTTIQKLHKY